MARASSPGRALLVLAALLLALGAVFDLARPQSLLVSAWRSLLPGSTKVERIKDDFIREVIPGR